MPMIKSRGDGTGFIGKGTKPSGWIPEGLATKRANKTHVDEVERGQTTSSPEKEREKTNMKVALFAVTGAMVLGVTGLRAGPGHFGDGAGLPPQLAEFDKNGDGKLDETERAALKAAMEAKRQAFIKKYDANGDGILSSDELSKAHSDQEAQRKAERTAQFATIDKDGNGSLSEAELAASLTGLSADRAAAVFARLDSDANKSISLLEYLSPSKPGRLGGGPGRRH